MNFERIDSSTEKRAFRSRVRAFLDQNLSPAVLGRVARSGDGIDLEFHRSLGQMGWVVPRWPSTAGGAGLDSDEARILATELLWHDAPTIVHRTTLAVTSVVQKWATDDVGAAALAGVPSGATRMCLGYTEPDAGSDLASVRTRATRDGNQWLINGQKMFTTGAHVSQYCLLLARSDPDVERHAGLTAFLVPLERPGITIRPIQTTAGERTNFVFYDDVLLEDDYRLGPVNGGWSVVSEPLAVEHAQAQADNEWFPAVGGFYANDLRRLVLLAGEGRKIDGETENDQAALAELIGEILLDAELGAVLPGPMSRVRSAEALIARTRDAVQFFGTRALLASVEKTLQGPESIGALQLFAQGTSIYGGTTEIFRNMLARDLDPTGS